MSFAWLLLIAQCFNRIHSGSLTGGYIAKEYADESTYAETEAYAPQGYLAG